MNLQIATVLALILLKSSTLSAQHSVAVIDAHVSSLPQNLLVRVGISNERRFDTTFLNLKTYKTIAGFSVNIDSLHIFKKEILNLKSIDIRSKLQVFYTDGKVDTYLIDGNGQIIFRNKIFSGNDYILKLIGFNTQ
jgi:hypothetical protein